MVVEKGNKIKVEYEGKLENGEVFDASKNHGKPLEFVAGEGMVVAGFDNAVLGMNEGEEKEVTLKPEEAYGQKEERAVQSVPKQMMPEGIKEGMSIGIPLENGQTIPARITNVSDEQVTIDMNHPLAGKTLNFKIKVLEIA